MITSRPTERSYPLAPMQHGMLFHSLSAPDDGVYVAQIVCELPPGMDLSAFKQAWQRVVNRHDVLRTCFSWDGLSEPIQRVCEDIPIQIDIQDMTGAAAADQGGLLESYLLRERRRGFDLSTAPLMRFAIMKMAGDRDLFLWTCHHMLLDGRSRVKVMKEVSLFYEAYCSNQDLELPRPPAYADYIDWFYRQDRSPAEQYWRKLLGTFRTPSKVDLPRESDEGQSGDRYQTVRLNLSNEVKASLQRLAQSKKLTVNWIVQAAWAVLLARYSGQEDVVYGETRSGRRVDYGEADSVVGLLINTVPIRLQPTGSKAFLKLLQELRDQHVEMRPHEWTPLTHIREASAIDRTAELFQSIVVFEEYDLGAALQREGCVLWRGDVSRFTPVHYPLTVAGYSKPDLSIRIDHDRQFYSDEAMGRLAGHLTELLEGVARDPQSRIANLPLLTNAEQQQVVYEWNAREADYPRDKCVHELFEEQAEKTPEAAAVVFEDAVLSYGKLNRRANQLAHYLRGLGVGPNARVGICAERGLEMIVGLLAVLKAGGAYVPLDAGYPLERKALLISDSVAKVILCSKDMELPETSAVRRVDIDQQVWGGGQVENPAVEQDSEALAYVMYTSGSTGQPKGVMVPHRAITRLVLNCGYADFKTSDRVAFASNPAFDASTMEVWAPLLNGGRIVVIDHDALLEPAQFGQKLKRHAVNILWLTVGLFNQYADALREELASLRYLIVGGDALDPRVIARVLHGDSPQHLINGYGPTETTTFAATHEITAVPKNARSIPIGRPIGNTRIYILDQFREPVPVGVTGELYIGGAGVARGYLNRPELTAERFSKDPFTEKTGDRMYWTGDLGRWLADGTIEFLGRNDFQVKIRGYRIELGEIEARVMEHHGVREAVMVAREDTIGDKRLVAYYTCAEANGGGVGAEELRSYLSASLPEHMVPAAYVRLERLPLTPNGKVDRKGLPAPEGDAYVAHGDESPMGETEKVLARIWAEVLKVGRVGRRDNFFELGGHSLLAMRFISHLRQALGVEALISDLFAHPVLTDFALVVDRAAQTTLPAITLAERAGPLPLSFAQQRLWFLAQLEGVSQAYHIPWRAQLKGKLDRRALRRTLDRIVARHEALRTTFTSDGVEVAQRVAAIEDSSFQLVEHDLRQRGDGRIELDDLIEQEARAAFDLQAGPLIRGRLIRLRDDEQALLITMHHIVSDGWSMGLLLNELSVLYRAFLRGGEADPLPPLSLQYVDYAVWQRKWMEGNTLQRQTSYWKEALAGAPDLLELPYDHPRPAKQDYAGAFTRLELDEKLVSGLKELSRRHGATLHMTLLAGWATLLARLSGQQDIVIGTPTANRKQIEVEELIGFFVNTLALRLDVSGSPTVGELLGRVKAQALAAQQHQDIPFEQVVEVVHPARSLSHSPIFQVMLAWQNAPEGVLELPGLEVRASQLAPQVTAKFDMTLSLREAGKTIIGGLEYATSLFEAGTIERYLGYFRTLLEAMVADDGQAADRLPLLSAAERHQVVGEWNETAVEYPREKCIHQLFEEQTERTPDAIALTYEDEYLSYGELNSRANRLAHYLHRSGVRPDTRAAICLERSVEMVVGVLGVIKAGGAYVPLDPAYPVDRLAYMLEDSLPVVTLTHHRVPPEVRSILDQAIGGASVIDLGVNAECWATEPDTNPDRTSIGLTPQHVAYVIYTSGSTGSPKGVAMPHSPLVNLILWQMAIPAGRTPQRSLQFAALGFDVSFQEIFSTLSIGAELELIDNSTRRDFRMLMRRISARRIERLFLPSSVLQSLVEAAGSDAVAASENSDWALQEFITAGEQLRITPQIALLFRHLKQPRLCNHYGPTETHVVTAFALPDQPAIWPSLPPIGSPISNTRIYLLDRQRQLVPVGVVGEIYIGGEQLARSYLNQPELTAERFLPDQFSREPGARAYKTGDLGRWLPDGKIEFLGRNDFQVKIRGYRIELGEIEARLMEHHGVREAVVVAREAAAGDKRLVTYYTCIKDTERGIGADELRRYLSAKLPEYMVPAAYVRLERLPLTPNGKVDRKGLPAPEEDAYGVRGYQAPVGETETVVASIWADVLKVERVGRYDNFFLLGGHSLLAMRFISQLRQTLDVEALISDLFEHPVLTDFALVVESAAQTTLPAITPAERGGPLPLSFAQQRLWFLAQMEGVSEAYHIFYRWRLKGQLNYPALRQALDRIVRRHEALRTKFITIDGDARQWIIPADESRFHLVEHDLHELADVQEELDHMVAREAKAAFDLKRGSLIRGRLIRLGEEEHALLITMHHIVSDGWSIEVLIRELSVLYGAYVRGEVDPLPELRLQYADYAVWQRKWMEGELLRKHAEYWERTLAGVPVSLELPTDHPRPAEQDYAGGWVKVEFEEDLTRRLKELSRRAGTTLYMTLLAGWSVLLARLSGQEEIVVGAPVANRGWMEIEGLIGFFVNTLALRLDVSGSLTVRELLNGVKEQVLAGQLHQDLPFEQVVEIVRPVRSLSHHPLVQVMFDWWQRSREGRLVLPGLEIEKVESTQVVAKFDLTLSLREEGERIVGGLVYAASLFERSTVERHLGYLRTLLEGMVADETQAVERLLLMPEEERRQLLYEWNATQAEYPAAGSWREKFVHELFEEQAEKTPDGVAVVFGDAILSYGELNRRANQLAHYLRELGVGPDVRVGICIERGLEMIVGLLAVGKAGGAYVPLDLAYPSDRLRYIVEDSVPAVLLTQGHHKGRFTGIENRPSVVDLTAPAVAWSNEPDTNPERAGIGLTSKQLAYVIYTSGSTGTPKGVVIEHRSLVNLICWHCATFELKCGMRSSSVASFGFDAATWEIWPPLCVGATLLLPSPMEARDPESLLAWWNGRGPDVSFLPTPIAEFAFTQGITNPLQRTLLVGGDLLRRLPPKSPSFSLVNNYGPTETTVVATSGRIELPTAVRSIGHAIANTQVYILDEYQQPVPIGVQGELYIGGAGVGRGYLNRPEQTAERFVVDPFTEETGARIYKTGDLGCWRADGTIEFLGRNDFQVKIRGYRIELLEIEARLAEHSGVREAVVALREDTAGDKRLVAYYTCMKDTEREIGAEELRSHLSTKLPKYMVPAAYVRLERLPLTPNGKLDRRGLPAPDEDAYGVRRFELPVGETETVLGSIWADVLKVERVGRYDNFFELGGHSLRAMRFISQLRQTLGVEVAISDLFAHPVLIDFALVVESAGQTTLPAITPAERGGPLPLSFAQQRLWFLAQMGASEAYHIFYGWRLKGRLDREALRRALDRIVGRHEALRTTFVALEGEPAQRIAAAEESRFHLLEYDLVGASDAQTELDHLVREEAASGFDLEAGPLIRGRLIRMEEEEHALLITMHHIVSDGWSMEVLIRELRALYGAFARGDEDPLPELGVQYADYAVWQRKWMEGEILQRQGEYWEKTLAGVPSLLELPTDHPRPAEEEYAGGWVRVALDEELSQGLRELSKKYGTTLYMTLLAGWGALLARLSGQEDVVIGTPVANRGRVEIEGLIGFFVNTLAVRMDVSGSPSVGELLKRVKEQVLAAQQHQDIPFEQVVENARPVRSLAHSPLFQVMFGWGQNFGSGGLAMPGVELGPLGAAAQVVAKFDLMLSLRDAGEGIVGSLVYATALYERSTVERYVGYLRAFLKGMVADETEVIDRLPLLPEAERRQVLYEWNETRAEYPRDKLVHELFEEQVEKTPDSVAVVYEDEMLSYGELNRRANRLAHYLRELGVGPDERVAICAERGWR